MIKEDDKMFDLNGIDGVTDDEVIVFDERDKRDVKVASLNDEGDVDINPKAKVCLVYLDEIVRLDETIKNLEFINKKLEKDLSELRDKYSRFAKNQNPRTGKTIVTDKYQGIIKDNAQDKTVREIYDMCKAEGFEGSVETIRVRVLEYKVMELHNKQIGVSEIVEILRDGNSKSKLTEETIQRILDKTGGRDK